jgi:hypothetical protein
MRRGESVTSQIGWPYMRLAQRERVRVGAARTTRPAIYFRSGGADPRDKVGYDGWETGAGPDENGMADSEDIAFPGSKRPPEEARKRGSIRNPRIPHDVAPLRAVPPGGS